MKKINENYQQPARSKSDIYRKFSQQFRLLLSNPPEGSVYVKNVDEEKYHRALNNFATSSGNDLLYLIGFTGSGKSTLLKKFWGYSDQAIFFKKNVFVIPISWNSIDRNKKIEEVLRDKTLYAIYSIENKHMSQYLFEEFDDLWEFYSKHFEVSNIPNTAKAKDLRTVNQKNLEHTFKKLPLTYALGTLSYVLSVHSNCQVDKIIYVIDDIEMLSDTQVRKLYETCCQMQSIFEKVYFDNKPLLNYLFSMRPHSFKYLQKCYNCPTVNSFLTYLLDNNRIVYKSTTPEISELFKARFQWAEKHTKDPGNPTTWKEAKDVLYGIVNAFDPKVLEMVKSLCHYNLRSVLQWFEMILSNRVWCQEFERDYKHPQIYTNDYRFDTVNIIRTLACGELTVYTGKSRIVFHSNELSDFQVPPSFDGSDAFIPNLLISPATQQCSALPLIIMRYFEYKYCSEPDSEPETEFIAKEELSKEICELFNNRVSKSEVDGILLYLFNNRVFRKNIFSKDTQKSMDKLHNEDYVYMTPKGSTLLKMFAKDSVLLEICREDMLRPYERFPEFCKSSYQLTYERDFFLLFTDLINVCHDIYCSEDTYLKNLKSEDMFYPEKYAITDMIISGVERSIERSCKLNSEEKIILQKKIDDQRSLISDID